MTTHSTQCSTWEHFFAGLMIAAGMPVLAFIGWCTTLSTFGGAETMPSGGGIVLMIMALYAYVPAVLGCCIGLVYFGAVRTQRQYVPAPWHRAAMLFSIACATVPAVCAYVLFH